MEVDQIVKLRVHDIGNNGEGVGSYEGYTLFVEGTLPGEEVEVQITECKKKYGKAKLLSILKSSEDRVKPECPLFDRCGGCQIMHLKYPKQLEIKQKKVKEALHRIGKIVDVEVPPCQPSPASTGYRNKIQLPVRSKEGKNVLGLYARSSHDLIEIDQCLIHCELGEKIYKNVKNIIRRSKITAYSTETGEGELRHVLIKSAVNTKEVLVILVTTDKASVELIEIAKEIKGGHLEVKGVVQNINRRQDNVILGRDYHLLEGEAFIRERICDLEFKISPASFFQVNPQQAECLYDKALECANLMGNELVLDAYCGVGTLSLIFAKHVKQVIGVECVSEAIEDAKENAKINQIENATFECANVEDYIKKQTSLDFLLLNPPRQGCDPSFLAKVGKIKPRAIIYISCDPATLARDLALLYTYDYQIKMIQPYDMFPQTTHVECVVKLERK